MLSSTQRNTVQTLIRTAGESKLIRWKHPGVKTVTSFPSARQIVGKQEEVVMAAAPGLLLAAVLLLLTPLLHCSSSLPTCPESCSCQSAPLLNCSSAGLFFVPQHIQDSVTDLDLSHNLLDSVTLDRPHHNLRNVWLGNNSITHLSLCVERNLRGRHVHRLRAWSGRGCVPWAPTLQLLSAERNQLEQLPQGLEGCESLQVLQLSFNRISTLQPGDLSHLRQLKELHLQHNLITRVHPQMFQDLDQLQVLDLSFNMLTSLHPLTYLSLQNIGADVRLGGNSWHCDCTMRSLRRRMAYDSSRGLQAWTVVCASPSIFSGRDLLQLEEDDLNCFNTVNGPELHQDVTVYRGSEILLSCSIQDSMWWTPNGQESMSQPQAGLLIRDITEKDAGLYVCVSEEHGVMSVFNLQISKIEGARRKTRSLPRISREINSQDTENSIGQERNQKAAQPNLVLAVCLSVFITFLVAFILGVLARPCIDVLWGRITKKKSTSATHSVSTVEQRQYDNEAYCSGEEPEHIGGHRERRVTFSTVDFREDSNVQYYDTVVVNQESINNDAVAECEAAAAQRDTNTAGDSGSENSFRPSSPEDNQRDGTAASDATDADCKQICIEFENIPDPVEQERRRSSSSSSDSSLSDKVSTQGDGTTAKSLQLAEDSVQQRAVSSTATTIVMPQISIEGTSGLPGFSSVPFADWSPHTDNGNLTDPDLWQENEEQFEFSDSVRSTSARSSSVRGSFNDSKLILPPTSDKQRMDDMSSSSSYVSEDEPTHYTVNSDREEEDIERNQNKPAVTDACFKENVSFEQHIQSVDSIRSLVPLNQDDYRYNTQKPAVRSEDSFSSHSSDEEDYTVNKGHVVSLAVTSQSKSLHTGAPSGPAAYSSSSSSDSETEIRGLKVENMTGRLNEGIKINKPETMSTDLDRQCIPQIKKHVNINSPLPASDSSSSDESADETTKHTQKQELSVVDPGKSTTIKRRAPLPPVNSSSIERADETMGHMQKQEEMQMTRLPTEVSQTSNHASDTQWPAIDLEGITRIKRRLDIKAPSPASDSSSSSDSEDDKTGHTEKQRPGKVDIAGLPFQESQTESCDPETMWPSLDLGHIPSIKRRLDIKEQSQPPKSSSSSDSDDETANHTKKGEQGQVNTARLRYDPQKQWPLIDLERPTPLKRRLDIKATSPDSDSSSSSDSENEKIHHTERPGKVDIAGPPFQEPQTGSHDQETRWPSIDLEHIPSIKRRLDIKEQSQPPKSSSSSDSDDETANHTKKGEQGQVNTARLRYDPQKQWPLIDLERPTPLKRRLDIKATSPDSDSSSSSDSENETIHHTERPGKVDIAGPPFQEPQTGSHDQETRWPSIDLEHIPRVKRRLNIKAPLPPPDSSSSSDSEDETTNYLKKHEQGQVSTARPPTEVSQTGSYGPQWPLLDLHQTTPLKRRLDIKAPSPDSDSSSSSDSEVETTHHTEWPRKVETAGPPFQEPKTGSHDQETRWPSIDLEHIPRVKRRLDIKVSSQPLESHSSCETVEEKIAQIKKHEQREVHVSRRPSPGSGAESHDPDTRWPVLDREHTTRIKRRLDVKATSPGSNSSSSSDSENESTRKVITGEQGETGMPRPSIEVSQTVTFDKRTQWPLIDLERPTPLKRRLDIKAPSANTDSSSSSDSEDETTHHTEWSGKVDKAELQLEKSKTVKCDPGTRWPALDLEQNLRIKKRLDIKAPSPASDSSSSSDSDDEERPGVVGITGPPFQESQIVSHDAEPQWPTLDLGNITRIKRRLDIKAPSPPPDTLLSGGGMNHTIEVKRQEAIKSSHDHSSSSSDEQEEGVTDLRHTPTTVEPDSRWPRLDLSTGHRVKRRLDIKAPHSPPNESSSSSDESEGGTTNQSVKMERDKTDMGITSHQPEGKLPDLKVSVPPIKRRLNINTPSPQPDPVLNSVSPSSRQSESNSSTSDSEDEHRNHVKLGLGVSAKSKATKTEFIKSPKTPPINISQHPKTDHNIKLEKYTVVTDDLRSSDKITPPEINPELQSRWATMNLGISRFRRRLEVASHTNESPNLPSTPPPASPPPSSGESGNKSGKTSLKRIGVGMQGIIHTESSLTPENTQLNVASSLKGRDDDSDNSVEVTRVPLQSVSSSSSNSEDDTIEHSVPDLSLGVPRIKRRLDVKAPSPEPSNSHSSSSESENEAKRYTANQSSHPSSMSAMTDDDHLITYKRLIIKPSSPSSNFFPRSGMDETTDHTEIVTAAQEGPFNRVGDRKAPLSPKRLGIVKKSLEQSRYTADVDVPPEIRWTGVGRQLPDLSVPSPRRHLDVSSLSPPQEAPAVPELPPPDSSSSSSSESDDNIKQETGRADVTLMHKHSSLSASSVSLASNRALDNSPRSASQILGALSEDRNNRKGLSALKAMSSERQKWDTVDGNDDHEPQGDTSFNYGRSEEDIKPLAKQPLTRLHLSSTSLDRRRAADLLYGIPSYRRHDIGDTELPQGPPPPIPATPPPPYEAAGLSLRSQSSKKQGLESARPYQQQIRKTEVSKSSSLTSQNSGVYLDSSNVNISEV